MANYADNQFNDSMVSEVSSVDLSSSYDDFNNSSTLPATFGQIGSLDTRPSIMENGFREESQISASRNHVSDEDEELNIIETSWHSLIVDPNTNHVLVGSRRMKHPFHGFLTKFKSFSNLDEPYVTNPAHGNCGLLQSIDVTGFVAGFEDGAVMIYDYKLNPVATSMRHFGRVTTLDCFIDGKSIVTGAKDSKITFIDVTSGTVKDEVQKAHGDGVTSISLSPQNCYQFITSGGDRDIVLWDLRSNKPRGTTHSRLEYLPTSVFWSQFDSNIVYAGCIDGSIGSFDIRNPKEQIVDRFAVEGKKILKMKRISSTDQVLLIIDSNEFVVVKEKSLETIFTCQSQGIGKIRDVFQVDLKTFYSVGCGTGFTNHEIV